MWASAKLSLAFFRVKSSIKSFSRAVETFRRFFPFALKRFPFQTLAECAQAQEIISRHDGQRQKPARSPKKKKKQQEKKNNTQTPAACLFLKELACPRGSSAIAAGHL